MVARFMVGATLAFWLSAAGAAPAEERTFICPAEGFTVSPGLTGELTLVVRAGSPGAVELHGIWGNIVLPAQAVTIQQDMVFANAEGAVEMRMPDRRKIDACIARKEKEHPGMMKTRRDAEVLTECRGAAPLTAQPVATHLSIGLMASPPPQAQMIVKRSYADEEGEPAERHSANSMATCSQRQR